MNVQDSGIGVCVSAEHFTCRHEYDTPSITTEHTEYTLGDT